MLQFYILNKDFEVIDIGDNTALWSDNFNDIEHRQVAYNTKETSRHVYAVSTVFIGMANSIFETVVFKDGESVYKDRTASTYAEAQEAHVRAARWVMNEINNK